LATFFVLIFHFENSHYINITLVFKAKTKNKIINPKTSIYLSHRSIAGKIKPLYYGKFWTHPY